MSDRTSPLHSAQAGMLDGPGAEGNFLGLGPEYSDYDNARVCILPVPFEATTSFGQGTGRGPAALIEASRNIEGYDCETESEAFRVGIHTLRDLPFLDAADMLSNLQGAVLNCLNDNKFVVTLGGEHTVSAAPIRACAEHFGPISVLQFDAHTDLRPAYLGNPLSHASVMARAKEAENVDNVVAVGIRALDKSELQGVNRSDLFFDHSLHELSDPASAIIDRLGEQVYITFDVDVFSSATMPSTGTPEPGGIEWFTALEILKRVCHERRVIGFDLVELMPIENFTAPDFLAAKLVYKFLNYQFGNETKG